MCTGLCVCLAVCFSLSFSPACDAQGEFSPSQLNALLTFPPYTCTHSTHTRVHTAAQKKKRRNISRPAEAFRYKGLIPPHSIVVNAAVIRGSPTLSVASVPRGKPGVERFGVGVEQERRREWGNVWRKSQGWVCGQGRVTGEEDTTGWINKVRLWICAQVKGHLFIYLWVNSCSVSTEVLHLQLGALFVLLNSIYLSCLMSCTRICHFVRSQPHIQTITSLSRFES